MVTIYRDSDGNECTLQELCRKEPDWAANVIATLEARWAKYTEPGVAHPSQAPERIWVQWMPRLRSAMVYLQSPAIVDGMLGRYVLDQKVTTDELVDGPSPFCLECGHLLTEADHNAPFCPYCGAP